ncbi:Uncharacterized protein PCOAH_00015370 [Plasmodium coatneyi]|uniref:Uncharacterized protein n=1 Tax=Plasmodium coatneyi TaxID=208452 RepID=A0A1B1DWN1_9APIC|nr:Uncharacterized protein PCOAH_00015370 [Plasmodium coatneyi]ANQ07168.1 Uncharacterized protein PCOAH_00015370 [Plasmodium coatneyi]
MAHSIGTPYTLYSVVDVDKPYGTRKEKYYVSEPYPPHPSVISGMYHGRFPSYYVDGDGYFYNGEEDFLMKKPKIGEDPKPDENKTGEVENKAESVESTNNGLTFFQAVMIIVLLMRLGRKRCTRLRRKHWARKELIKYLDKVNEKIKKDDLKMEDKLKKLEKKIKTEEKKMEVKWKEKRTKARDKIAKKPSKDTLPGVGPFYDKDKRLLDKKLDIVGFNYDKYKYNKKRRWNSMKATYHKKLKKVQDKQEKRKRMKCRRMFLFERRWNFGPKTMKKYLQQKQQECDLDKMHYTMKEILEKEEEEEKAAEEEVAEGAKEKEKKGEEDDDDNEDEEEDDDDDDDYDDEYNDNDEDEEEELDDDEEMDDEEEEDYEDDNEDEYDEDDEGDVEEEDMQNNEDDEEDDDGYYENSDDY